MPVIGWIKKTFNCFTTRVYNMALRMDPCNLEFVPDRFKAEDICNKAVRIKPYLLRYVPDHLKTKEICDEAVSMYRYSPKFVPDHLKTKDMCDEAVGRDAYMMGHVLNNLSRRCVIRQWIATHCRWNMFPITLRHKNTKSV